MSYDISLTADQLHAYFDNNGISTGDHVLNYLQNAAGLTYPVVTEFADDSGTTATVTPDPSAQLLLVSSDDVRVTTDANLRGIVQTAPNGQLYVSGAGNEVITAVDGNDQIYLDDSGNDKVWLGPGNGAVYAEGGIWGPASTGNDAIHAGNGDDTLFAGAGHDTLYGAAGGPNEYTLLSAGPGSGSGKLISGSSSLVAGSYNVLGDDSSNAETMIGGSGADQFYITGSGDAKAVSHSAAGGPGAVMYVTATDTGDNTLFAGAGNDSIWANGGDNTIHGGAGHDSINVFGNAGSGELLSGSVAGSWNVLGVDTSTAQTLHGAAGQDSLYATGSGNDTLITGTGPNLLDASGDGGTPSSGNDTLIAHGGASDTLYAGSGNDLLDGSANTGNSDFFSYAGANSTMEGGNGNDSFQVSNTADLGAGTNNHTIDISFGAQSQQDWVGFQDRASTDGSISGPSTVGGITTYTVAFNDGQTVDLSGTAGSGTTVDLDFTNDHTTVTEKF